MLQSEGKSWASGRCVHTAWCSSAQTGTKSWSVFGNILSATQAMFGTHLCLQWYPLLSEQSNINRIIQYFSNTNINIHCIHWNSHSLTWNELSKTEGTAKTKHIIHINWKLQNTNGWFGDKNNIHDKCKDCEINNRTTFHKTTCYVQMMKTVTICSQ